MVSTVQNPGVRQKDAERALVIAVTSRAVFHPGGEDDKGVYSVGVAFPLLQALQRVNERLLQLDPEELLLLDVVLITTDSQHQQQTATIISSTRHYGLQVNRFSFSSEDDFVGSLLQNQVQLFLTTDGNEVLEASQKDHKLCVESGVRKFQVPFCVLSVLLDEDSASCPSDQLRVVFCDGVDPSGTAQRFWSQLGEIRQRFGMLNSPLCISLVTSRGNRDHCSSTLRELRSFGISVDEVYCLAGAPRGPILSLLQPHFLLSSTSSKGDEPPEPV